MQASFMGSNGHRMSDPKRNSPGLQASGSEAERQRSRLVDALSDLHDLLEQYGPAWYTEEHHEKAELALLAVRTD